ncbi:MAG TPA: response regulator transcription factor [Pedobacter sp.]|jgi:DNA-binding LytR/AlgR family response regulator
MKYKCLIIDDEPDAHVVLKHYCEKHGQIEICGNCFNALEAVKYLESKDVDFIFLDISMPEISGFGFLSLLKVQPKVIFTTAYSQHALQSFEHNVIDYLLKPVKWERFAAAINKLSNTVSGLPDTDKDLFFKGIETAISAKSILYAESLGNYAKLHLADKTAITHTPMHTLLDSLTNHGFIRIHKRYIVQKDAIITKSVDKIVLINETVLPVGISYRQFVSALLGG